MKWEQKLVKAKFLKRYKRFFADIEIDSKLEVAHVANTGSLKTCLEPNVSALVLPASNPERKLRWTLIALETPSGSWVGVDTSAPNKILKEVAEENLCDEWKEFSEFKPEVKITKETRLDGLLSTPEISGSKGKKQKLRYLEVKNVTFAVGDTKNKKGIAQFPDAVTERGQKHLRELMNLIDAGHECELIFAVQRVDCVEFRPADEVDPEYGKLLRQAIKKGLIVSPWLIEVDATQAKWSGRKLPVNLE